MLDGRANIDLIFRNGLKDYEVSPPPEAWSNIQPAIGRKKKYMFLLQSAASIAILVSVGMFAYWLGYETSKEKFSAELVSINIGNEPVAPVDIVIPLAIIQNNTEPATVVNINTEAFETVEIPAIAKLEVAEEIYVEDFDVVELDRLIAEIESFTEIQTPLAIEYANLFSTESQSIIFNDSYERAVTDKNRWSILAMAAPTYYSQFATSENELARQIVASDQGRASYSGGVGFAYKISDRVSIQSGFYYSTMGQELGNIVAYSGFEQVSPTKGANNFKVLTPNGTVSANNPDIYLLSSSVPDRVVTRYTPDVFDPAKANLPHLSNSIYQDFSYIELPLLLRFKTIDRKVGVSFVGGVSYNFLIGNSAYTVKNGKKYSVGTTEGMSDLSLSSSFGMGMEYKFSTNLSFNIEPTFRYYLNPSNSGIAGLHNYSLGIFSGVAYKF